MELVYLWVEDYKNIKKQGFNFSPRFRCEYDDVKKELTIDENDDYISDFFGENINVTAIVGKNGSGKSSVLDQTIYSIFNNQNTLLVVEINEEYYCFHRYPNPQKFTINSKLKINKVVGFDKIDILYLKTEKNCPAVDDDFLQDFEQPSFYDEITDLIYIDEYSEEYRNDTSILLSRDKFGLYAIKLHQLGFNIQNLFFDFKINYFHINVNNRYLYELLYDTSRISRLKKKHEEMYHDLRLNIYDMYLYNIFFTKNIQDNFFEECMVKHDGGYNKFQVNYEKAYDILKAHNVDISVYHYEFEEFDNYLTQHDGDIDIKDISKIKKNILPFYTFNAIDSKNRGYSDLSYGEKNIIIQLMAIYYRTITSEEKSIFIVLDEPDISLHPSWQKRYLNQIIQFLSQTNKKIQLLTSTHSPFLLSDIPKQSIIFLNKDENGNCKVVDGLKEKKQTFGANIHTLLSDSFFMEDGLMGEFAKGKINEIIEFHKEVEENKKKKSNCFSLRRRYLRLKTKFWQTQSIIGEDYLKQVIRNHLVEIEKILLGKNIAKKEEITRTKKYLKSLEDE